MLSAVILICSLGVARADCDETSASAFHHAEISADLPMVCLRDAQSWFADQVLHDELRPPGSGEYVKIRCSHHEFGARRVG